MDSCPAFIGLEPSWEFTTGGSGQSRLVGRNIAFRCTNENFYEGEGRARNERRSDGQFKCSGTTELKWEPDALEPLLPCTSIRFVNENTSTNNKFLF